MGQDLQRLDQYGLCEIIAKRADECVCSFFDMSENGEQIYSSEFRDKNDNPAPQIRFVKRIDGSYYVVEAACENRYQKLWVQSAYLQKNEDVTQAPAEGYNTNHETNARSALASPSSLFSISEKASGVNGENVATLAEVSQKYGKQAKAMEHTYIAGQDVEKFDQSYQLAYDMGKNGVSFDYVTKSAGVSYLTDSQKRLAYEAGQAAAESSTTLNETGETVKVKAVAAFENGKMSFTLDNGEVVAADQLTLSDGEALLHNAISGMDISAQEANRLWQGYDGSISAEAYANGITEAYHYGRMGVAYGNIDFHAFAAALPEQVRKNAYEFGKRALDTERAGGYNKAISEMEVQDDGTKEAVSHRGNVESPGRMGKENSGGEGSARESVGRRIAEILRKKVFGTNKAGASRRGRIEIRETREDFERRTRRSPRQIRRWWQEFSHSSRASKHQRAGRCQRYRGEESTLCRRRHQRVSRGTDTCCRVRFGACGF